MQRKAVVTASSRNIQNVVVAILLAVCSVVEFKFCEDFRGMFGRVMWLVSMSI
jgi:hypothetical protein